MAHEIKGEFDLVSSVALQLSNLLMEVRWEHLDVGDLQMRVFALRVSVQAMEGDTPNNAPPMLLVERAVATALMRLLNKVDDGATVSSDPITSAVVFDHSVKGELRLFGDDDDDLIAIWGFPEDFAEVPIISGKKTLH